MIFLPGAFAFTLAKWRQNITFRKGVLKDFEPKFKSVGKDCDRYFDALLVLSETGAIRTDEVIALSGAGSLWIARQYIEKGLLDLVEADILRDVTSRDTYGPLFEGTRLTLERLLEVSEYERVSRIYRAAIKHRLKALKSVVATQTKTQKANDREASKKWVRHYVPALREMMEEYRGVLQQFRQTDSELDIFEQAFRALQSA